VSLTLLISAFIIVFRCDIFDPEDCVPYLTGRIVLQTLQVPCGSGNALAACCGLWDASTAAWAAVCGRVVPLDIASVVGLGLGPEGVTLLDRSFSFLSLTYGMIPALDIGTEGWRWMGGARFTMGALREIATQRTYGVKAAWLPEGAVGSEHKKTSFGEEDKEEGEEMVMVPEGPLLRYGPQQLATLLRAGSKDGADCAPSELLLPPGWIRLDAERVQLFAACNLPRLDMTFHFAPEAAADSGEGQESDLVL
jgi:hypothetical protein